MFFFPHSRASKIDAWAWISDAEISGVLIFNTTAINGKFFDGAKIILNTLNKKNGEKLLRNVFHSNSPEFKGKLL